MATDLGEKVRQALRDAGLGDKVKWKIGERDETGNYVAKLKIKGDLGSDETLSVVHIPASELQDRTATDRRIGQLVGDAQIIFGRWLDNSQQTVRHHAISFRRLSGLLKSIGHGIAEDLGVRTADDDDGPTADQAAGTRPSDRATLPGQGLQGLPDHPAVTSGGATSASEDVGTKVDASTGAAASELGPQEGTDPITGLSKGGQEWPSGVGNDKPIDGTSAAGDAGSDNFGGRAA